MNEIDKFWPKAPKGHKFIINSDVLCSCVIIGIIGLIVVMSVHVIIAMVAN